ncbi:MAG: hypothetical protein AAFU60_00685, partial [Bacteroidota bacterium]
MLFRCTQKVAKRLGEDCILSLKEYNPSMDDWHINLVRIRNKNWFLFIHSLSLFTFFAAAGSIRKSSQLVPEFEQELSLFIIRNISVKDGYIEKLIPRNST